jgi:hypothetical protein
MGGVAGPGVGNAGLTNISRLQAGWFTDSAVGFQPTYPG